MPDEETKEQENHMLYVGGSRVSFRCEGDPGSPCGGNVFHQTTKPGRFACNSCGAVYVGEPKKEPSGG